MHGLLDRSTPEEVAKDIYRHEYFIDARVKGMYRTEELSRSLNYFGDPLAQFVKVAVTCRGKDYDCAKMVSKWFQDSHHKSIWPYAHRLVLRLSGSRDCDVECPPSPRAPLPECPLSVSPDGQRIDVSLPAGTNGIATLQYCDKNGTVDGVSWGQVELIHAANSACKSPKWIYLKEVLPDALVVGNTTSRIQSTAAVAQAARTIEGEFEVHVPTTGGYRIFAYWNEVWDEALPTQIRPAQTQLCFTESAISPAIPTQHGDKLALTGQTATKRKLSVRVVDGGFGYGSGAIVLVECNPKKPPSASPVFSARVLGDRVEAVDVLDPGEGVLPDTIQRLVIARQPPVHRCSSSGSC